MKKFITFEGIDGCGKTTQINLLSEFLNKINLDNYIIREPGNTNISEKIRDILLNKENCISSESETLLFMSARAQLVKEIIIPKLKNNVIILCDRFSDSTLAYQGYGRGINIDVINQLNLFATKNISPYLTIILDVDPLIVLNRKLIKKEDRIESEGAIFQNKVRNGYLEIAKNTKRCEILNCNNKTIEEVHLEIVKIVKTKILKGVYE